MPRHRLRTIEALSAVVLVAYAALNSTRWPTPFGASVISNVGQCVTPALAACAGWVTSRRTGHPPTRRAWTLLAASAACWALGQAVWTYYELSGTGAPFPSLADAGYLAVPLALCAIWALSAETRRSARIVTLVDGLIIGGALLAISWPIILGPSWRAGGPTTFAFALSLAYPMGNLAVATLLLTTLIQARRQATTPLALITIGLLVLTIADSIFVLATLAGTETAQSPADVAWTGGYLLIFLAARRQVLPQDLGSVAAVPAMRRALLPFAVVAAALGVRVWMALTHRSVDTFLSATTFVVAALVLVRQLMTMHENRALNQSLADKVRQLTDREDQLRHLAFHDPLTGLANRQLFRDRVGHALDRTRRSHELIAVLFIDLDDFKTVNDSLGHASGDRLLVAVASRLGGCVRPGDTVSRLGGDEFGILLEEVGRGHEPESVAARIMESLEVPFPLEGREVFARASVGFAIADGTGAEECEHLLADADVALYAAKSGGKATFREFATAMRAAAVERLELGQDLRRAVERDEFLCHYQPIVDIVTGRTVALEALVRWEHPERGLLQPGTFIGMAEEVGIVGEIATNVLRKACSQAVAWRRQGVAGHDLAMHVNLSGRQLQDPGLLAAVREVLTETGFDPALLVLEITESVMVDVGARHLQRLVGLRATGVRLAIDDFGAGYSSLNYLRALPVDVLKIDRVFAENADGVTDPVLLEAIVKLGRSLGVETIAEGIERHQQAATLRRLGCRRAQGFLYSPPVPSAEVPKLLTTSLIRFDRSEPVTDL